MSFVENIGTIYAWCIVSRIWARDEEQVDVGVSDIANQAFVSIFCSSNLLFYVISSSSIRPANMPVFFK
jgi:hypothetical protein